MIYKGFTITYGLDGYYKAIAPDLFEPVARVYWRHKSLKELKAIIRFWCKENGIKKFPL